MIFCRETNENIEVDISEFINFLEDIKEDYQNGNVQLCTVLSKFQERYKAIKLKSISWLVFYLYDLNCDLDLTVNIRSEFTIRIQVESIKQCKTEESERKRKLLSIIKNKENLNPQIISSQKKKKTGKKEHDLNKNILKNQLN